MDHRAISPAAPACIHAWRFADEHGNFTYESIMKEQAAWGLADTFENRVRAAAVVNLGKKTPQELCTLVNPARSGIWNEDGTFNPQIFSQLESKSVLSDNGLPCITYKIFMQFLLDRHGSSYTGIMSYAYCLPITWAMATDGSVKSMINEVFTDCAHAGDKGISIDRLKKFYTDPKGLSEEIENKYKSATESSK